MLRTFAYMLDFATCNFYRAMHVLQSAVLLSQVVSPSVRPSVRLFVCNVEVYRKHIGWTSSKLIIRIISFGICRRAFDWCQSQ